MEAAGTAIDTFDAIQLGQNELSVSFSKETKKVHDIEDDGDDDEDDFYDKLYEDDDLGFRWEENEFISLLLLIRCNENEAD